MEDNAVTSFKTQIDEGPSWWNPEPHSITRLDEGYVDPRDLLHLPGFEGEHLLFENDPTGGYGEERWRSLVEDIKVNGLKWAILIFKEMDGRVGIYEGNHRLRAAIAAGITSVPVEIRYFGNSQRAGLVVDPRTGKPPGINNTKDRAHEQDAKNSIGR
ncbi:MAG: ParB N-terminal domain-containing protein [Syntrophaceae bacterium]|nr:ParB N-terminal domain-containing protein [Syntrophaceae bacterium]